ncbi:hypothetical protein [Mycobacterium persicum]|uniref:hypothetical protein n=1 Tax=Mycobacterium persicum TaxID=1487726 RepID=UPI0009F4B0AE|nr:hypothetical protein [Mycobacterium persicum]ORB30706.1 hypothetical protein BST40_28415 [Mycobacterium persicum]
MTTGIEVAVRDGFATIDFIDPSLRGPALEKLIDIGGHESIDAVTRVGPRKLYRVPEGNAREAGLLDADTEVDELAAGARDQGWAQRLADVGHEQPVTLAGQRQPEPDQASLPDSSPAQPLQQTQQTRNYPEGEPSDDWKRPELDSYAKAKGLDPSAYSTKAALLDAINGRTTP